MVGTEKGLRNVLITGARGALGRKVAQRFLQGGVQVFGTFHSRSDEEFPDRERIQWIQMDVTRPQSIRQGLASVHGQFGEIDGWVHCAGGFRFHKIEQVTDEDLDFLIDTNFRSAVLILRELIPAMKKHDFGRIVLVSARASLAAPAGMGVYAASKSGLNALVGAVSQELRDYNININAVLPTIIDTAVNRKEMPKADFSSWVTAESLSEIIFSLTQPWGQPINGALIPVSGRL